MNEFLPKELKDYIAQNQDTLVKLLDTLCRIPAPSNHEELRAEFIRDWFEKEGCRGAYIDSALNVIYPFHCESQKDLLAFTAHSDTVFPDMEPFDVVYDGDIMRCPGVGRQYIQSGHYDAFSRMVHQKQLCSQMRHPLRCQLRRRGTLGI